MAPAFTLRHHNLCWECFATFSARPAAKRLFCSVACYAKYKAKISQGSSNPHWKGGVAICRREGRVSIAVPDHPHARSNGYVYEYRLVMEKQLGRLLAPEEIVHHINGDPTDNRPENLAVMSQSEHAVIGRSRDNYGKFSPKESLC